MGNGAASDSQKISKIAKGGIKYGKDDDECSRAICHTRYQHAEGIRVGKATGISRCPHWGKDPCSQGRVQRVADHPFPKCMMAAPTSQGKEVTQFARGFSTGNGTRHFHQLPHRVAVFH